MQTVHATVFAIARNDENILMSAPDNYSFLPLSGAWKLAVLNKDVYDTLVSKGQKDFGVTYSPAAEKDFGYIDHELKIIAAEKVKRFYIKPTAAHFLGLLLGWSLVDDDGTTYKDLVGEPDAEESWVRIDDNCWHGDIDSVILNLVMPKGGGGACGCGSNRMAVMALDKFLRTQMNNPLVPEEEVRKQHLVDTVYRDDLLGQAFWFIAYVLDAAGFTEHGSGIRHGWLQGNGTILAFLIGESVKTTATENTAN